MPSKSKPDDEQWRAVGFSINAAGSVPFSVQADSREQVEAMMARAEEHDPVAFDRIERCRLSYDGAPIGGRVLPTWHVEETFDA